MRNRMTRPGPKSVSTEMLETDAVTQSTQILRDNAGDYTTTSTSFTDIDGTNLSLSLTTTGGDVLVWFTLEVQNNSAGNYTFFDVDVDSGTLIGAGFAGGITQFQTGTADRIMNVCAIAVVTGLSAGSHTFDLQWQVEGGTAFMHAGGAAENDDTAPILGAIELKK